MILLRGTPSLSLRMTKRQDWKKRALAAEAKVSALQRALRATTAEHLELVSLFLDTCKALEMRESNDVGLDKCKQYTYIDSTIRFQRSQ